MRHFLLASQDVMRYSTFCPGLFKLELQNTNPSSGTRAATAFGSVLSSFCSGAALFSVCNWNPGSGHLQLVLLILYLSNELSEHERGSLHLYLDQAVRP